jgi:hypothetical protein
VVMESFQKRGAKLSFQKEVCGDHLIGFTPSSLTV